MHRDNGKQERAAIVCGVTDSPKGREAALLAHALGERLGLRLVLAHAVDVPRGAEESLSAQQQRAGAERALAGIARELGGEDVEVRVQFGDPADLIAWIAAEERAALVVLGSERKGLQGRRLRCRLAQELAQATPVPVLVAPPQTRRRSTRRLAVADAPLVG